MRCALFQNKGKDEAEFELHMKQRSRWANTEHKTEFAQLLVHIDNVKLKSKCIQEFKIGNMDSKRNTKRQLVEALRYKPEGHGFDSRWCHWNFSLA